MNKSKQTNNNPMDSLTLGQTVDYVEHYDASILQPVPRQINRDEIAITGDNLPFSGVDIWNGYELSWLNSKGKPQIAILQCSVPADSNNLIESKSFKLYLNSFNQSVFNSIDEVQQTITQDLSECAGAPVDVTLVTPAGFEQLNIRSLVGNCIDDLDVEISHYDYSPSLLQRGSEIVTETLVSHLLKSNCLITNQPDWGSVLIHYHGPKIDHQSLLKYLISFRTHNEFHEQCVERIFCDLMTLCGAQKLTVYARYTRRGGLDINPFRSNFEQPYANLRLARQ
ncbi:NADPH-dependent 7-cyano-7-deazaguanine reductase QueF [Alteromonas sp. ASW11-36]|uniref:NADPH-dependent 7-cyano-7-deazaguanine reductase n=1 Tax=Alteromonas arenosi TaxID=3055817 RepID=A0ABT7SVK3_9ALTE|nr:NADPH-dependent 7-cyano-7-deazaguanine reductase QueF [Alteromonas sp. ASW11-36]MDM7860228.1 NADPH-dependent 7-cyano-7-deazaguanine reductase QueF [Alteromonas sp. ASW11-36]